jgi:hypothetical protein
MPVLLGKAKLSRILVMLPVRLVFDGLDGREYLFDDATTGTDADISG